MDADADADTKTDRKLRAAIRRQQPTETAPPLLKSPWSERLSCARVPKSKTRNQRPKQRQDNCTFYLRCVSFRCPVPDSAPVPVPVPRAAIKNKLELIHTHMSCEQNPKFICDSARRTTRYKARRCTERTTKVPVPRPRPRPSSRSIAHSDTGLRRRESILKNCTIQMRSESARE